MITYRFNEDRSKLILVLEDKEALEELMDYSESMGRGRTSSRTEAEALESMIANSELDWVNPSDTGDLTDAPMLGITGGDDDMVRVAEGPHGVMLGGRDEEGAYWYPILERWAYMGYEIRSFLDDLLENGEAVFVDRY